MMNRVKLNEKELKSVTGGDSLKDDSVYNLVKKIYIEKGINSAITLCLYYHNSQDAYAMIKRIGEEIDGSKS